REKPVPEKAAYMKKDLADWARSAGLAIKMPPTVFPVNSVKAMRGCVFLGKDTVPFARAVFELYWGEDKDISQDAVLTEACRSAGLGPKNVWVRSDDQTTRAGQRPHQEDERAAGVFAAPALFMGNPDFFSANHALPLLGGEPARRKERAA